ncbi:MAG: hypothetical protein KTR31_13940 [Myxococcales bacterium]|nr:hypothetical protein [Myxococcales bacterium]
MNVALLSCARLPEPDPDEAPLLAALKRVGVEARVVAWDAPEVEPSSFDAVVIRATWNYPQHIDAFEAFLQQTARHTTLINPWPVVRRNLHKRYLLELRADGLPVVPTQLHLEGGRMSVAPEGPVVVKPAVSAGSWLTRRFDAGDEEATAFLEAQLKQRDMLVQPVVTGFMDPGERSWICIDGELVYGVRKIPRFAGQQEAVHPLGPPSDADRHLVRRALDWIGEPLVFARVDVVEMAGQPVISELECVEPSLFLETHRGAADRLAQAIVTRLYP